MVTLSCKDYDEAAAPLTGCNQVHAYLLSCPYVTCHCLAQCLYSNGGYTYLDVRSALEVEEVGKVKDSVNIPFVICTRVWDPQEQKKVVKKENNNDFIAQVSMAEEGAEELFRKSHTCYVVAPM